MVETVNPFINSSSSSRQVPELTSLNLGLGHETWKAWKIKDLRKTGKKFCRSS